MGKILITRKLSDDVISRLSESFEVDVWGSTDEAMPRGELIKRSAGVDAILCMLTDKIDAEVVDRAGRQLKVVSTMSVGFDHIDIKLLKDRGIKIGNTPGVLTDSVADLTVALMLAVSRRLPEAAQSAKSGDWGTWSPYWLTGRDLSNATVGIVGMGAIGAAVASRLAGFNCKIVYSSRSRKVDIEEKVGAKYTPQDELLAASDFVTVHSALTSDTAKMCDSLFFSRMKREAIFINTSRGGLVDHSALYEALSRGELYAAGLDVTDPEPLPLDSPLYKLKNCIVLPHIASASIRTRKVMADMAVENVIAGLSDAAMPHEVA